MPAVSTAVDIGSAISAARKVKGLSQAKLAELAGVNQPKVSEIERGKDTAQIGLVLRIIAALELPVVIGAIGAQPAHGTAISPRQAGPRTIIDEPQPDAFTNIDAILDKRGR